MFGIHWEIMIPFVLALTLALTPVIIGFAWVWPDAKRRGQPGWLWALLTIPFNWIALIAYLIVRSL